MGRRTGAGEGASWDPERAGRSLEWLRFWKPRAALSPGEWKRGAVLTFRGEEGRHVYFVNLLGVVLLVAPLALAGGRPPARLLLEQVPCAVVDGNHLRGDLLGFGVVFWGAGEFQLAQDLSADRLDPLAHELVHVERAAGRQAERDRDQMQKQKSAQHTVVHFFFKVEKKFF